MRNKLSIMNKRQEITEEELDRFKNFDALLIKYNQTIVDTSKVRLKRVRWVMSILVIGITSIFVFYLTADKNQEIGNDNNDSIGIIPEKDKNDSITESVLSFKEERLPQLQQPILNQAIKEKPAAEKEAVMLATVYVQAEPMEGYAHLYEYFNNELIYPSVALKDSTQGVLTVSFTINRKGLPENLQFTNSLGEAFEEEAKRLILNMPLWKPATLNNQPVASRLSLPLTFQIQAEKKTN